MTDRRGDDFIDDVVDLIIRSLDNKLVLNSNEDFDTYVFLEKLTELLQIMVSRLIKYIIQRAEESINVLDNIDIDSLVLKVLY